MKNIVVNCLILLGIIGYKSSFGQSLSAEVAGMESAWSLSGSFNAKLSKTSKLSFSNISRISSDYLAQEDPHMLVMTNLGYAFAPKMKSTFGAIYTDAGGLKPSIGLQYLAAKKHMLWMLFPNLDIGKQYDLMTISMVQYLRTISERMKFVARIQSLCILGSTGHLFSTLRFRSGFIRGKYQFGVASDLDFYGNDFALAKNLGLFLQYQVF
jgi:hypothetical protein